MIRLAASLAILLGLTVWAGVAAAGPAPAAVYSFDIDVSLEWTPGAEDRLGRDLAGAGCPADSAVPGVADPSVLQDLQAGLTRMADYFYSYTRGQMAIGKVTIHTGGANWDSADIRVLANRSYRPSASVGGIVAAPLLYQPPANPNRSVVFKPGAILLGRHWDGEGSRCGPWSAPAGWRTLGHEWAHYALYLYDEYIEQRSGRSRYCGSEAGLALAPARRAPATVGAPLQSLLAYHYSADQLSLWGPGGPPPGCDGTPQAEQHNEPAWATIPRFYPSLTAPAPNAPPFTGPPALAPEFVIESAPRAGSSSAAVVADGLPSRRQLAQAYLIRPNPAADGAPLQIIGQGGLLPGETARFLGVDPASADRAAVIAPGYRGGPLLAYPADYRALAPADTLDTGGPLNRLAAAASTWRPSLTITPRLTIDPANPASGQVSGLDVSLRECGTKELTQVEMAYCPAGGACGALVTAEHRLDGSFGVSFSFAPGAGPAAHGYIYAREPFRGAETVTWYQLAGGVGPAHSGGHAPLAEGELNVDMPENEPGPHNRDSLVLYSPAQVCADDLPLPTGVIDIVGQPYSIQAVLGDQGGGRPWGFEVPLLPLRVRLNYDQDLLDRLGIDESQLVLLRQVQSFWEEVPAAGRSPELNWIMAEPQFFPADGAVYALGIREAQLMLPLLARP